MLTYVKGDLLDAFAQGIVPIIGHCCNAQGNFGSGIAASVKERFGAAYKADQNWYHRNTNDLKYAELFELPVNISVGSFKRVQQGLVPVGYLLADQYIFNLYGQEHYGFYGRQQAETGRNVSYPALAKALVEMRQAILSGGHQDKIVGFPKHMASFRAGGNWEFVEQLIIDTMFDLNVYIYELPEPEHFKTNRARNYAASYSLDKAVPVPQQKLA